MNPAVRDPKGACIEEQNCNWEKATVCAFSNSTTANKVSFLACMDESNAELANTRKLLGGGGGGDDALAAAQKCAPGSSVDPNAIKTCYNGPEGDALLEAASKVWNKAFPGRASVPHTNINDKTVQADYGSLKTALCSAGSTASACNSIKSSNECYA